MPTIKELHEKYGKGKWGKHFRVRHRTWAPEDWFEPGLLEPRTGAQVYGEYSRDGNLHNYPFATDINFEICKPFKMLSSAVAAKEGQIFLTSELFEDEDQARIFCGKQKIKYLKLDEKKIRVVEDEE